MDPRLQLVLLLTDKIFTILQHAQEVKEMSEEEVAREILKERFLKDSLVKEVTTP